MPMLPSALDRTRPADRIHGFTKVVAAYLGVVVFGAFVVLYFFPAETARLFAWPVAPPMTAMFMGASYANGVVFFAAVLRGRSWHRVWAPHVGVAAFATLLLVATVVHWDRFNHGHPVFWAWIALYATAPVLVPIALARNAREDPRTPEPDEPLVPVALRRAWLVPGVAFFALALAAFVAPAWLIPHWPWKATPLTMRVIAAFYSMLGVAVITVQNEARWSAWRVGAIGVVVWHALVLLAAGVRAQDFTPGGPRTAWLWSEAALLLGSVATLVIMELRRARMRAPAVRAPAR
jgi:hypothetical protein